MLLTARSGGVDRIVGLDSGADDYIVKPFSLGELYARMRAVMRRGHREPPTKLESGGLVFDLLANCARHQHHRQIGQIDRGYERIAEKLHKLGAKIQRVKDK